MTTVSNGAVSARGLLTEMVQAVRALDCPWSDVTRLVLGWRPAGDHVHHPVLEKPTLPQLQLLHAWCKLIKINKKIKIGDNRVGTGGPLKVSTGFFLVFFLGNCNL